MRFVVVIHNDPAKFEHDAIEVRLTSHTTAD